MPEPIPINSAKDPRSHRRRIVSGIASGFVADPHYELPLQPKAIIGRESALAVARQRLLRADVRLLTLTGPPGVGKTRFALALANHVLEELAAAVCFVDLAPIVESQLVVDAIARALELRDLDARVGVDVLVDFLRDKALLLILDNFEQVLEAAEVVGRLLAACPALKVVATSRAPLHLRWEHEFPVPPLELPARNGLGAAAVAGSAAGQLFIERAQAVAPDFVLGEADAAAVAQICADLDGLPLAIELAAARVKLFPPRALVRRLHQADDAPASPESPLRLLAGQSRDLPPRHQTLLKAISWSYDLLGSDEQKLLRRLSVFVGGCTIEAAEAVGASGMSGGLDIATSLVDKSLVWREVLPDGEPRLRMFETIRQFAWEQLMASDEADTTRARHAAYYVQLVEQAALEPARSDQQAWFGRVERERSNLRAVEAWASGHRQADTIVRLAAALWPFWLAREDAAHARDRLAAILNVVAEVAPGPTLARALHGAGLTAEKLGDYATCRSLLQHSVTLARQLDDRLALAAVLDSLGRQEFIEGRYAESRSLLEESHTIVRELDDRAGLARVLSHLGFLDYLEGRPESARAIFEHGLVLAVAAQDEHRVAEFKDNLGNTAELEGNLDEAAQMFEEAISIWRRLGQGHWLAMALNNLGKLQIRRGELESARSSLREALGLAHRIGNRRRLAYTLSAVAALATAEGHAERATRLEAIASAAVAEIGALAQRPDPAPFLDQVAPRAFGPSASTSPSAPTRELDRAVEECLVLLAAVPVAVPVPGPWTDSLTRRERDVVALLARGLANRQIAEALVLTEGTVENYVQRILGKLGFNNRAQIAVWATQRGLGDASPRA
jgi:predicted ATPase/DNA-binding CsgD family transcriptional regulator